MQHVSVAEFAFCLGKGCLRWDDLLWEQSKVQVSAFPPRGRRHPVWQREPHSPTITTSPNGVILQVFGKVATGVQQ